VLLADEGRSLQLWDGERDAIEIALGFAQQKFGRTLSLSGLKVFQSAAALLLIAAGATIAYLRTAFTDITIDTARITCEQGILNRQVESLELFRVRDVTSLHPWCQRPFGIGTVIVLTSDSNNPRWRLPGMRDAEHLRQDLNVAAIALRDAKGIREVNMERV
jgi:uncharacterized membrane protein YdbT with pleckstrin-like domain